MKRYLLFAAAAVLAGGGLMPGEIPRPIEPVKAGGVEETTTQPVIDKELNAASQREITRTIVQMVNGGFSKNGLSEVVGTLSKADRQRIGILSDAAQEDLNLAIASFRKSFYARYGQDFQLKPEHLKKFITLRAGSNKNSAIVFIGTTNENIFRKSTPEPVSSTARRRNSLPILFTPVILNFVNEGTVQSVWRIDLPDTIDATTLRESLVSQITKLDSEKMRWPDDAAEAYHVMTAGILSCLVDSTYAADR